MVEDFRKNLKENHKDADEGNTLHFVSNKFNKNKLQLILDS